MSLHQIITSWLTHSTPRPRSRHQAARRNGTRFKLEQLEDRTLLSNFTAASVSDLIADINAANLAGGANTIALVAGNTFSLTAVDNTTDGATGLPVIAANDNLTIVGNGDTIERSTATGTPAFRLLDIAAGASLTLQNLTLQGGLARAAVGMSVSSMGGGIYSQGSVDLSGVTVQNNSAQFPPQYVWGAANLGSALGGGIYSNGSLTLEGGTTVLNNQALGGDGYYSVSCNCYPGYNPGYGFGGGLYVAGGTVTLNGATVSANTARGGIGHAGYPGFRGFPGHLGWPGGNGYGGGMYVAAGTVAVTSATLAANTAQGGQGPAGSRNLISGYGPGIGGNGFGGALYVAGGTVTLTSATVSANTAQGGPGGNGAFYNGTFRGPGRNGGNGFGGALYVAGGTVTLLNDTVTSNSAQRGTGGLGTPPGSTGLGAGGGLYINPTAAVSLDTFTRDHVTQNTASTSDPDIFGSYTLVP